jgi:hypothetical protein
MLLETMDANAPGLHDRSRFHDVALFFPVSVEQLLMDDRYQAFGKHGFRISIKMQKVQELSHGGVSSYVADSRSMPQLGYYLQRKDEILARVIMRTRG